MHGAGIHLWDLSISSLPIFAKVSYPYSLSPALTKSTSKGTPKQLDATETALYAVTTFCIKVSILLFFLRLSVNWKFHLSQASRLCVKPAVSMSSNSTTHRLGNVAKEFPVFRRSSLGDFRLII
jgi:hypothetical protein